MEKIEKCWCKELYRLPEEFQCKKFECGRYRANIRSEDKTRKKEDEKNIRGKR